MNADSSVRHAYDQVFGGDQNLGTGERIVSTGLGLAMAAGGLRKGASWQGAVMGLVGAALIARGMSGHCPMKAAMQGGDSQGWMSGGHSHDRLGGHDAREEGALDRAATQAM
ncbi:YgaP family membrane protein [Azospirillum thermophilum]|uniref:DUF2892 domain-containing protein n=1 Tax=Azospirillum thermophilum TaxID=2202148 RepID=A0A2S2D091_9PROT|nr:DUF2892 domain-containing protein [Azospirillum thermophilum]AWK90118.1 DUF2892 domain-containing protein [Azospirillum thermophilum]